MKDSVTRRRFIRTTLAGGAALGLSGWALKAWFDRIGAKRIVDNRGDRKTQIIKVQGDIFDKDLKILLEETAKEWDRAFSLMARRLRASGDVFAADKLSRTNIFALCGYMVLDHFDEGARADRWFRENLDGYMTPPIVDYNKRVEVLIADFEDKAQKAFEDYARRMTHELNQLDDSLAMDPAGRLSERDIEQLLRPVFEQRGVRFGTGMVMGGLVVGTGSAVVGLGRLVESLTRTLRQAIVRVLRPVVGRAITRVVAMGPTAALPVIGVLIAVGGAAWTGVDFYRLSGQTQKSFKDGLNLALDELKVETKSAQQVFANTIQDIIAGRDRRDAEILAAVTGYYRTDRVPHGR